MQNFQEADLWKRVIKYRHEILMIGQRTVNTNRKGVVPTNGIVRGLTVRLKHLKSQTIISYLGSTYQFNKYIPSLSTLSYSLRDSFKEINDWK